MPIQTVRPDKKSTIFSDKKFSILFYLLVLTGFFVLVEISFFIQCNKAYLADFTLVTERLSIPAAILPDIYYFLFAQGIIHLVFCLLVWCVTLLISQLLRLVENQTFCLAIFIWMMAILTMLVANQVYFPNSKFSELTALFLVNPAIAKTGLIILSLICCLLASLALIELVMTLSKYLIHLALIFILATLFWGFHSSDASRYNAASKAQPNIIIIGIDSLRPDFLGHFGFEKPTPFLDSFLNQATVFSEAITPLARTFPSWVSILTGEYPRTHGIRSNLTSLKNTDLTHSMPAILQKQGYETVFATDETRFSNIDGDFGFDRVATPPMGLSDFLLGTFNDFPLSNLLVNTIIGQFLFPYSYANRPVYFTYDPNSFLERLKQTLNRPRTKPLFLAVHFCLPHHPYLWAGLSGKQMNGLERYAASVQRVDQQLSDFFIQLKKDHLLDNAIVVLLSDHGEALSLPGDRVTEKELFLDGLDEKKTGLPTVGLSKDVPRFYPPTLDKEEVNQSSGHGTDVLGLSQYHSLLAFKLYGGNSAQVVDDVPGVVSLLDIKPTLLALLGMNASGSAGMSLASQITGKRTLLAPQYLKHLFLESDFSPEAIRTVYPETRKVMLEGIRYFQINPRTMRLTVKEDMLHMIIKSKQYADIYDNWMLALYPQDKNRYMPILISLKSGLWTNNLQSTFAQQSPAKLMLNALNAFYGDEIGLVE